MDHYRWMETDTERTTQWLTNQSNYSRNVLNSLPWRDSLEKSLNTLVNVGPTISNIYNAGKNRFYLRSTVQFPYQRLFVKQENEQEKVIVDPPPGYGIKFFSPSHDGNYVAYGLSINGYENTEINIINVSNGLTLKDNIPQVRYPNVVWDSDNKSFYYSKHDDPGTKGLKVCGKIYLHNIGDEDDTVVYDAKNIDGLNEDDCESVNLYSSVDSEYLIVNVSSSISGYSGSLYLAKRNLVKNKVLNWSKIIDKKEKISSFIFSGKWIYLAKYNSTSGYDIYRMDLDRPESERKKIIEWSDGELTGLTTSRDSLYIAYHDSGKREFVRIPFADFRQIINIPKPFDGEVTAVFSSSVRSEILFTLQGWLQPPAIFNYNPHDDTVTDTGLITPVPFHLSNFEVEEQWVSSKDHVKVPLTIIHRKGIDMDGSTLTWLSAYGAYGVSSFPHFYPSLLIWLEHGGAIAIAHVRGGGELGPSWHEEGRASNKENSITDFISCAEYLVDKKYTNPSKLVISGESAGGIVIGMAMTKRPELFSAAAIDVGMLNTSQLDKIPIGPMNFKEFGSPFTAQGKSDLEKIDAYRHLKDGVKYPPVLLTVGLKDERVSPWQTAKFAARLEDTSKKWKTPVLVLADKNSGHNSSTYEEANSKYLDIISFFIWVSSQSY
ncbi:prolyl oligopeptidase family serine peptidase [Photobacterium sp. CCB-ST2H9]|uniref:prolyl oligopeptidase family serine peptidase n=1 Tax=Photobacterium sp. CCB-ST2H9 TaxID=2912855 RepID=UPI002003812F|nr:prolyl oligopeptidase family serine peptidase [Photobacterium sp. CCB-ST2H9]UTM57120.1 prolyl oligopeptidase family serine peptidase [Photobacterium sp. CCB-ST2H9]